MDVESRSFEWTHVGEVDYTLVHTVSGQDASDQRWAADYNFGNNDDYADSVEREDYEEEFKKELNSGDNKGSVFLFEGDEAHDWTAKVFEVTDFVDSTSSTDPYEQETVAEYLFPASDRKETLTMKFPAGDTEPGVSWTVTSPPGYLIDSHHGLSDTSISNVDSQSDENTTGSDDSGPTVQKLTGTEGDDNVGITFALDSDGDVVKDEADNCVDTPNPGQDDLDDDGKGDQCDSDWDGDGWENQAESSRGTDPGDPDTDSDSAIDPQDNCPTTSNQNQEDLDGDGDGDPCDSDKDGDGHSNSEDAFPKDREEWQDTDGDGVGNNADQDDDGDGLTDGEEQAGPTDPLKADTDDDGVNDSRDAFPVDPSETKDTDGDGVGDNADAFPEDPTESEDTDGDEVGDNSDVFPSDPAVAFDADSDGVGDTLDACPKKSGAVNDTDGDGVCDKNDVLPQRSEVPGPGAGLVVTSLLLVAVLNGKD